MKITRSKIIKRLSVLIGQPLTIARRAAGMRVLHFGEVREVENGTVGEWALHIQCEWRIEKDKQIFTGSDDLREPIEVTPNFDWKNWNYHRDGNLQDKRIEELLTGYNPENQNIVGSHPNHIVRGIEADDFGGLVVDFVGNFRLVLFPSGTDTEFWRFFRPKVNRPHFVVERRR
jgi:hypothetical protein